MSWVDRLRGLLPGGSEPEVDRQEQSGGGRDPGGGGGEPASEQAPVNDGGGGVERQTRRDLGQSEEARATAEQRNEELEARLHELEERLNRQEQSGAGQAQEHLPPTEFLEGKHVYSIDGRNFGSYIRPAMDGSRVGLVVSHPEHGQHIVGYRDRPSQLFVDIQSVADRDAVVVAFTADKDPVEMDYLGDNTELKEEADKWRDRYQTAQSQLSELERKNDRAQTTIRELMDELTRIRLDSAAFDGEGKRELNQRIQELQHRLEHTKEHSQRMEADANAQDTREVRQQTNLEEARDTAAEPGGGESPALGDLFETAPGEQREIEQVED